MPNPQVPHLKVPFSITGARADVVEQDSFEEVEQCVEAVLRTPIGRCIDLPEFGAPEQVFRTPDVAELMDAVSEWEPRAKVAMTEEDVADIADAVIDVHIDSQEASNLG